jgi:dTDP-4-amino-4,6-dideoxygalactose transaminase
MMPFIDLKAQQAAMGDDIHKAIAAVLAHGAYIMGPEVTELEKQLAAWCGVKHALSCSNGTDAMVLYLRAKGVGPGDVVMVPAFTFTATAEVVSLVGATPMFVDVCPDCFNMCPKSLREGLRTAKQNGWNVVGVIPVDLFGQPADYDAIEPICAEHGLWMLCDAAQSFGGSYKGRKVGAIGEATSTSFFPAKPLGCYGDGGAIFTDNDQLAEVMRSIRVHGQGRDKYENVRIGLNARLDSIQAAVLIEKLKLFPAELAARQKLADAYNAAFAELATVPELYKGNTSSWAQYTLRLKPGLRDKLSAALKEQGIPTAIYYPIPLHHQEGYKHYPSAAASLPVSEQLSAEVISLPMHGYMGDADREKIIAAVKAALRTLSTQAA